MDPWDDVLARWLLLLGIVDQKQGKVYEDIYKELELIAMKDNTLKSAFQGWDVLSASTDEVLAYEARLKQVLDEEAAKREAELREKEAQEKGLEKGLEKGREEGREEGKLEEKRSVARKMLLKGLDVEEVLEFTELSRTEVLRIKDEIGT